MRPGRAVVIGGSVAGMLAAGALARHFEAVTVLERDRLEDGPVSRKGAPQGNQIHILLQIGERRIEEIFSGIHGELVAAGCAVYDQAADVPLLSPVGWRCRSELEVARGVGFRRPLLEWLIRRRVADLDNVEVRQATVAGLVGSEDGADLAGVGLKGGEMLAADLVVDAAGRGTRAPKWLGELGFDPPAEAEVRVHMGYATQFVEIPDGALDADARGIGAMPWPGNPVGAVILPADNGVHSLAAIGLIKNYPPSEREGMLGFLERAGTPLIAEIARDAKPVSPVHTYRMPGNLRRRWEDLDRRPGRFAVVGDAVASFDPIYGQGVTMAAIGATLLDRALADAGDSLDGVAAEFQRSLAPTVDAAFAMAAGADAVFAGAELHGYARPDEAEVEFGRRLEELATVDVEVLATMMRAARCLRPELLGTAAIRAKVDAWVAAGRRVPDLDPRRYPQTVHRPEASHG